jgi:hypothetical protein
MSTRIYIWLGSLAARAFMLYVGYVQASAWEARIWLPWLLAPSQLGQRWLLSLGVLGVCGLLVYLMPDLSIEKRVLAWVGIGALTVYWAWLFAKLTGYLYSAVWWPWLTDPRFTMARLLGTVLLVTSLTAVGYVALHRPDDKRLGDLFRSRPAKAAGPGSNTARGGAR